MPQLIHNSLSNHLVKLPLAHTTASNCRMMSDWETSVWIWTRVKPCQLAWWQLLTWLSKQLQKLNIDPRHTKVISITLLQYGHRISVGNAIWIQNNQNQHLQFRWILDHSSDRTASSNPTGPSLKFRSILMLKVVVCSVPLQPNIWKQWWVIQWPPILWMYVPEVTYVPCACIHPRHIFPTITSSLPSSTCH
jgi:hypothetical protein